MKDAAVLPLGCGIDRIAVPDDQRDEIGGAGERFEVLLSQDRLLERPVESIGPVGMGVKGSNEARRSVAIAGDRELQLFHVPRRRPPVYRDRIPRATSDETAEVFPLSRAYGPQHFLQLSQVLQFVPVFIGAVEDGVHGVRDRPPKHDDWLLSRRAPQYPHKSQRGESADSTERLERAHFEE